jgi:hypothetical protein
MVGDQREIQPISRRPNPFAELKNAQLPPGAVSAPTISSVMSDLLPLSGVAIVVIGLALRLRTTLVVASAGIVTGLAAELPLFTREGQAGIIDMLGKAFADNRLMTLFVITLPAIGLAERYGLQQRSAMWIRRIRAASAGRLAAVYQLFRVVNGALGIRIGGHWAQLTQNWAIFPKKQPKRSRRPTRPRRITGISMGRTCRPSRREFCWSTA